MTTDTLTRDEIEALMAAPFVGHRLDIEPDYELEPGCRCGSCWTSTGRFIVSRNDDRMMMEADAQLLAAAPALAATALHHMTENERLQAELAEARLVLAAERGEAEGAVSDQWVPGPGGWCRYGPDGQALALCERPNLDEPVLWYAWPPDESARSGKAAAYRDAMRAADTALEATDGKT